jgi:hypothetical protein
MSAPPFTFTEERNTVYYHNIRVYIAGADVTPWLTSQVVINRADRDGIGSATFNLSNQYRAFEITQNNVTADTKGNVTANIFRLTDPYLPEGRYSELAKFIVFSNKNSGSKNIKHAVSTYGPIQGVSANPSQVTPAKTGQSPNTASFLGAKLLNGGPATYTNPTDSATARYPFNVGSLVFHKYDPVRIFVQNPFSRGESTSVTNAQVTTSSTGANTANIGAASGNESTSTSANANTSQWTCEFAGYIDVKPFTQNYVNGESVISVSCQDIRVLMQQMRTQTNPAASIGIANANNLLAGSGNSSIVAAKANAGFFNDLVAPYSPISHILGGKTFIQSIKFLLFGVYNSSTQSNAAPTTTTGAGAASGSNSSVVNGPTPLTPTPASGQNVPNTPIVASSGQSTTSNLGGVGRLTEGQTVKYDPSNPTAGSAALEDWNNLINFGVDRRYLTYAEMLYIGSQTFDGGEWAPDNQQVFFLLPYGSNSQSNLVEYNQDGGASQRVEWATRLELLQQVCKSIDYQFYVTGMGDVVFEFPMYDFFPLHFNAVYNSLYSFGGHLIDDSVSDEGGTPISGLLVTSRSTFSEYANGPGNPASDPTVANSLQLTRTIFSNVLASRIGMHIETHDVPGVTNQNRLTQLGMIEFNKRLAEFNKFDMNTSYRPYINVNRPIYHMVRKRIGITKTVSFTFRLREDVTLNMGLTYTRQQEQDGKFRFITGGEANPISYSKIYDSAYLPGTGVETSIGGAGTPVAPAPTNSQLGSG